MQSSSKFSCPAVTKRIKEKERKRQREEVEREREGEHEGQRKMRISFQQLSVNLTYAALTMWCLWSVCGCLCVGEKTLVFLVVSTKTLTGNLVTCT